MLDGERHESPTQPPPVDYDARYRKGWAYGKAPNDFLVAAAATHMRDSSSPLAILSLGEGQGRNAVHLATLGHLCTGVDSSPVGLSKALALAAQSGVRAGVHTVVADLCDKDFSPSSIPPPKGARKAAAMVTAHWDVVVSIFCALPPADRRRVHRRCAEALRKGGIVIIEAFAPGHATAVAAAERERHVTVEAAGSDGASQGVGAMGSDSDGCFAHGKTWTRSGPTDAALLVSPDDLRSDFAGFDVLECREVRRRLDEGSFHRGDAVVTQFVARRPLAAESREGAQESTPQPIPRGMPPAEAAGAAGAKDDHGTTVGSCGDGHLAPPLPYRASMDAVFDEAEASLQIARAVGQCSADQPLEFAIAALEASASTTATQPVESCGERRGSVSDPLLSIATAAVHIACRAAARDAVCRYCWLSERPCLCPKLSALLADQHGVGTPGPGAPELEMARDDGAAVPTAVAPLPTRVHWVFVVHPTEFLRATSTAKIAAQLLKGQGGRFEHSSELLVVGASCHRSRIDALVHGSAATRILFPIPAGQHGQSVRDALADATASRIPPASAARPENWHQAADSALCTHPEHGPPALTFLVPDGSWECARALVREVLLSPAENAAAFVELDAQRVRAHRSLLLEALHAGSGKGRLSTLEACALCLEELSEAAAPRQPRLTAEIAAAGATLDASDPCHAVPAEERQFAEALRAGLQPLLGCVADWLQSASPSPNAAGWATRYKMPASPTHDLKALVPALRAAALSACNTHPLGLRRCCVCGVALATPLNMQTHLSGRRHCEAVARRFQATLRAEQATPTSNEGGHGSTLACTDRASDSLEAAADDIFEACSTAPLWATVVEPPDVALAAIHQALQQRQAACKE